MTAPTPPPPPPPPQIQTAPVAPSSFPTAPVAPPSFPTAPIAPPPQMPQPVVMPPASAPTSRGPRVPPILIHLLLMGILGACLCIGLAGVWGVELMTPTPTRVALATPTPTATLTPTITPTPTITRTPTPLPSPTVVAPTIIPTRTPGFPRPVVELKFNPEGRFGLKTTEGDPRRSDDNDKRLTYDPDGSSSNTRVSVDGSQPIFGSGQGKIIARTREGNGEVIVWEYNGMRFTQRVTIALGSSTNLYDTAQIEYTMENSTNASHQVGLRMMIDTLIGNFDGVPFAVPGRPGVTDRAVDLQTEKEIPDFIQVLETGNLANPGVIVKITLRGGEATPPDRVVIASWPGQEAEWDYLARVGGTGSRFERTMIGGGKIPDSAVGLYYLPKPLAPGETRRVVAFYGLGDISSVASKNPNLGLSISSNRVEQNATFWIVASVNNPQPGQRVTLGLPPQLEFVEGGATQPVDPAPGASFTTRSWLVRAKSPATQAQIVVTLEPNGITERQTIDIVALPTPTPTPTRPATPLASPTAPPTPVATPTLNITR